MLLIITGCINVNPDMCYVTVRNADERLSDYLKTIKWSIESPPFSEIIFCENSNVNLDSIWEFKAMDELAIKQHKKFEYYSFLGDTETINDRGKGYGEGEIIEFVYNRSNLMKTNHSYFKITGRLLIHNIEDLRLHEVAENMFCFDVLSGSIDTRFYRLKISDYEKYFIKCYEQVDDKNNNILEYVFYKVLMENKIPFKRFIANLVICGRQGSTGIVYQSQPVSNSLAKKILYSSFLYNTFWGRSIIKQIRKLLAR